MVESGMKIWHGWRKDTLWQIGERATRAGLGFLVSVIVARSLGPADFGLYSYALATIAIFAFLGQAGIDALLLRELVRAPESAQETIGQGFILRLIGALFAGITSLLVTMVFSSEETTAATPLVAILALSGLLQSGWVVESWLQANKHFGPAARAKIGGYVMGALGRLLVMQSREPLLALAIVNVLEMLLCTTFLWRAFLQLAPRDKRFLLLPTLDGLARLWRMATPMLLSALTIAIYSRIDVFMLGRMQGTETAGLYTAGTLLSEGLYVVPTALMAAASPRLAKLFVADAAAFPVHFYRVLRLLSALGLVAAIAVTLLAPWIVPMFFGASYGPSTAILQIHVWSTWFVFVSSASDPWYINHDFRIFYLAKTTIAAVLNIALNFLLIPKWQGAGAALATLFAYATSAVLFGALFTPTRPLFAMQVRAIVGLPYSHPSSRKAP